MAIVDIRQRTGYLFLVVVVGHVLLISTQVTTRRGVPMLEAVVFRRFLRSATRVELVTNDVREWWQTYFALQQSVSRTCN